ncbi:MAG TPA: glycosyltransferase family 9 protein [Blastocatellia bacterium]|nr:glycosyltransferase family 9 protein [Blastocatellia bacterium]
MTPCLTALKAWRPGIKIIVVSEPLAAPLLEDHPLVDNLLTCGSSARSRLKLLSELRRLRLGLAINLHGGSTATLITALSGANITAGYSDYSYSWMQSLRVPSPDRVLNQQQIHSVEQQLALLKWCGVPLDPAPLLRLAVSRLASESINRMLSHLEEYAVIAPAAAFESKQWEASSFAAICDWLHTHKGLPSIVVAGPGQEQLAQRVAGMALTKPRVLVGLTLKELVALLSAASIFVGNDSGPMHIAAAFDRPIVAVFGPSKPGVWHPWTRAKWSIPFCHPASEDTNGQVRRAGDFYGPAGESIKLIPTDAVIGAIDGVLRESD